MKAVVFIADARMETVCRLLQEAGMLTTAIRQPRQLCSLIPILQQEDLVVLPVRGTGEQGEIVMKGTPWDMKDFWAGLNEGVRLFTGVMTPFLRHRPQPVTALLQLEEVVSANAVLTAEGILALIMTSTSRSVYEQRYDIIGSGHCGLALAEMMGRLGLSLRIVSRSAAQKLPWPQIRLDDWQKQQPWDVVINTAPARIIHRDLVNRWNKRPLILDIASGAVGVSQEAAAMEGMKVIRAAELPSRFCPESAGRILASAIVREVKP